MAKKSILEIIQIINNGLLMSGQTLMLVDICGHGAERMVTLSSGRILTHNETRLCVRRLNGPCASFWYDNFDKIYKDNNLDVIKKHKQVGSKLGGKITGDRLRGKPHPTFLKGNIQWNKYLSGNYPYTEFWQTGKTKENDVRLARLSENRKGAGNPMYGTIMSDKCKTEKSDMMKQRILDGTFTLIQIIDLHTMMLHIMARSLGHPGKLHIILLINPTNMRRYA